MLLVVFFSKTISTTPFSSSQFGLLFSSISVAVQTYVSCRWQYHLGVFWQPVSPNVAIPYISGFTYMFVILHIASFWISRTNVGNLGALNQYSMLGNNVLHASTFPNTFRICTLSEWPCIKYVLHAQQTPFSLYFMFTYTLCLTGTVCECCGFEFHFLNWIPISITRTIIAD